MSNITSSIRTILVAKANYVPTIEDHRTILNWSPLSFTVPSTNRSPVLGEGMFSLEIRHDKPSGRLWLQYWIDGLAPSQVLDSSGLQFQEIENLRSYLRNGYISWDGSTYVDVETLTDFGSHETRPEIGYAMIQLLPRHGENPLLLGFDRHDRFQHTFRVDTLCCPPALIILTLWDQKDRTNENPVKSA